jgi:Flp pilus assembly protein CpaB
MGAGTIIIMLLIVLVAGCAGVLVSRFRKRRGR